LNAQVLISTEEIPAGIDPNALLEIRNNPDPTMVPGGILIPKVDLDLSDDEIILPNMDNPTDGIMVYNIGTHVENGIWYYDGIRERWINNSNPSSVYSLGADNYAEYYEYAENEGHVIILSTTTWLPWSNATYDETAMGAFVDPIDNFSVDVGEGVMMPSDVLVINDPGIYQVTISGVFLRNNMNLSFITALHVNNMIQYKIRSITSLKNANYYTAISANGIVSLDEGDIVDLRFKAFEPPSTECPVEIFNINLTLTKIGE
jgi:hypothetical protein